MYYTGQKNTSIRVIGWMLLSISILICPICAINVNAQSFSEKIPPIKSSKQSWQRLLLQLSSTYFTVVTENQVNLDSSLVYVSHSLGLSRLILITEGFDAPDMIAKSQWIEKQDPHRGIAMLNNLHGRQHAIQLLLLGAYYTFHPRGYSNHQDSISYFLDRAIAESSTQNDHRIRYNALCLKGKAFTEAGNFAKADVVFTSMVNESDKSGDKDIEAKAYAYWGLYTVFSPSTTANRIKYLQKAYQLYQSQNNTESEINVLTNMGYLYVTLYQLGKAESMFQKTLDLEHAIQYPYTYYTTEDLAMVTGYEEKFGEPFKYTLETINTAVAARDSIGWGFFFSKLETFYFMDAGKDPEALKWGLKALDRMLINKQQSVYINVSNLISLLTSHNRVAEARALLTRIYKAQPPVFQSDKLFYYLCLAQIQVQKSVGEYADAKSNLLKADSVEKIIEKTSGIARRAAVEAAFGDFNFRTGDYDKAKQFFTNYINDELKGSSSIQTVRICLERMVYIDSVKKDLPSELIHLKQLYKLANDNYRLSKTMQEEELDVKYNTQEKESQITLLSQKSKLEQASLKQANLVKDVTVGGILFSLAILALLYKQNKLKQKKNDIISNKNNLLQHLVTEKEWLLKEVHHRVKNNLHTVICLLESQAAYLENDALKAIENSQHRIYAMSLIHQKLYQSDDIKAIDMKNYLIEFINYLKDSFGAPKNISIITNIESIYLGVSQAIPVGLILNEALNNTFKYAFPNNRGGEIRIEFNMEGEDVTLLIGDNGIGLATQPQRDTGSLGLDLMKGLATDLKGNITFESKGGTTVILNFVIDMVDAKYIAV